MKKFMCGLLVSLTLASQLAQATCSSQLREVVDERGENAKEIGGAVGGFSFFLVLASYPTGGVSLLGIPVAGATVGALLYKRNHAKAALETFEEAYNGRGGPRTTKIWNKFNRKHPDLAAQMDYQKFLTAIHEADLNGDACRTELVLEKRDFVELVVD